MDALSTLRNEIAQRAPQVPEDYRKRLQARLASGRWPRPIPSAWRRKWPSWLIAAPSTKNSVGWKATFSQFADTVHTAQEAGKKLDFLLQEMNREVNTIGSKASDSEIARRVVAAKCVIEKLREQVQNVV